MLGLHSDRLSTLLSNAATTIGMLSLYSRDRDPTTIPSQKRNKWYVGAVTAYNKLKALYELHSELQRLPSNTYPALLAAAHDEPQLPSQYADFADVFSGDLAGRIALHSEHDHAIDLEAGKMPPQLLIYNLSQKELQILYEYLDNTLAKGQVRPSKSPSGAPILFVLKKDRSMRLYVDYYRLNRITIKNRYPLPLISELLEQLGAITVFTKLNLYDTYYRLRIKEGDEQKTAFKTQYGLFEYLVMPFSLANMLAIFQAYIYRTLGSLVDSIYVVYLDDILIYSTDEQTYVEHVRHVL